eukprot:6697145-Alexandrium_andersonii.AAC.1
MTSETLQSPTAPPSPKHNIHPPQQPYNSTTSRTSITPLSPTRSAHVHPLVRQSPTPYTASRRPYTSDSSGAQSGTGSGGTA